MKAFVTSIGEKTTDLCVWSLERNGFDVTLLYSQTSLAEKLKEIYKLADESFIRVDADVIVNRNLTTGALFALDDPEAWWIQFMIYDWFRQDVGYGGVQYVKKEALSALRKNVDDFLHLERPETGLFRLPEFDNPRRCMSQDVIMGLHGYKSDIGRVKEVKERRGQLDNYDFELAQRMDEL